MLEPVLALPRQTFCQIGLTVLADGSKCETRDRDGRRRPLRVVGSTSSPRTASFETVLKIGGRACVAESWHFLEHERRCRY
jgi:hypothetical protein